MNSFKISNTRHPYWPSVIHHLTVLLDLIASIPTTPTPEEVLTGCAEKLVNIFGADSCALSRWQPAQANLIVIADFVSAQAPPAAKSVSSNAGAVYPLDHFPASRQVLLSQTAVCLGVDDLTADDPDPEKNFLKALHWHSVLIVPMLADHQAIGLLTLYATSKGWGHFTAEQQALCQALANQIGLALDQAHLRQAAEEGRWQTELMQVISRVLSSETDTQRIWRSFVNFAYRLVNAQFAYVAWPAETGFHTMAGSGPEDPTLLPALPPTLLHQATKRPYYVPDIRQDPDLAPLRATLEAYGWRALVVVPLLSHDQLWGLLVVYADQVEAFSPNDIAGLMSLASQAAVALQNARLVEALEQQRAALHQVSLRLVQAQEAERRRIARELHDELGQLLTALKLNLEAGRQALLPEAPAKLKTSLQEASSLAIQTMESARNLSLELHPAILDDLGLIAALRWEIDRYKQRTGQSICFEAADLADDLGPEVTITIYRVVIEAMTNIARHAQAREIFISLVVEGPQIVIQIEDDGIGFEVAPEIQGLKKRPSLGLVSMRERAELLGGQLRLISAPGRGTKVCMHLPL